MDALTRHIAERLSTVLGQAVTVENRTGASGLLAAQAVAHSPADGSTILMGDSSLLIASYFQTARRSDPLRELRPVAGVSTMPLMLVASPSSEASDLQAFLDLLVRFPGRYSCGTPGIGTVHHLGFELLKHRMRCYVVHIPYKGASQLIPDVISGQISMAVVSASAGLMHVRSGHLKAIALMSRTPLPTAPAIPHLADALPGFDVSPRQMLLAPAATPVHVVDAISDAVKEVVPGLYDAGTRERLGILPAYLASGPLASEMVREAEEWSNIIRNRNLSTVLTGQAASTQPG